MDQFEAEVMVVVRNTIPFPSNFVPTFPLLCPSTYEAHCSPRESPWLPCWHHHHPVRTH